MLLKCGFPSEGKLHRRMAGIPSTIFVTYQGFLSLVCPSALSELILSALGYVQKRFFSSGDSALGVMSRRSTGPLAVVIMRGKILVSNKV